MNLHYFLENGFTLRRKEVSRSKKITEHHDLILDKETTLHFIEFQDGLEGEVEAVEDPLIPALGNYLIKIRFENEQGISLTFATTVLRGGYVLKKSFIFYDTKYGNHEYECLDGSEPHYLLICLQTAQNLKIEHRKASGVKME